MLPEHITHGALGAVCFGTALDGFNSASSWCMSCSAKISPSFKSLCGTSSGWHAKVLSPKSSTAWSSAWGVSSSPVLPFTFWIWCELSLGQECAALGRGLSGRLLQPLFRLFAAVPDGRLF